MSSFRTSIAETLYLVYEAKRFSEKNDHVNARTEIFIQREGTPLELVQPEGLRTLEQCYLRFGLSPLFGLPSRDELVDGMKKDH